MNTEMLITKPITEINEIFYGLGFKKNKLFKPYDFLRSDTAHRTNVLNEPTSEAISNIIALNNHLVGILKSWHGTPPHITSGYRCPALNRLVGGAQHSYHLKGRAVDLWLPSSEIIPFGDFMSKQKHSEFIRYKSFIHFAL